MKLEEALALLEAGPPDIKGIFKKMLSGDFKNLQNAYFKGDEGTFEYPRLLKRLMEEIPRFDRKGEAFKMLQAELKVAEAAKRAWQKTELGKYL